MSAPLTPPPRPAPVTLFRLDGCPGAAELRALFDALGVAFTEVPLGQPHTPSDACGYTSPSVQIATGSGKPPEFLVQPSKDDVVAAIRAGGQIRRGREPRTAPAP